MKSPVINHKLNIAKEFKTKRIPRYALLHQSLLNDIESGKYPVGSYLPTEEQLGNIYGVSRHTVREATRKLVEAGMIIRSPSTGTIVNASQPIRPESVYISAFGSIDDLMMYTSQTRLDVFDKELITLDTETAQRLGARDGEKLLLLHTHRKLVKDDQIISYTRVYLRPEFESIQAKLEGIHPSVFDILQNEYGEQIHTVKQEVEATTMPKFAIKNLRIPSTSVALKILRIYYDQHQRFLTASDNFYIKNKFRLMTTWHKDEKQGVV